MFSFSFWTEVTFASRGKGLDSQRHGKKDAETTDRTSSLNSCSDIRMPTLLRPSVEV
jgi:hypothetical protein